MGSLVDASYELIDPCPDVHALFVAFDARFFDGALAACEVKWSPRMTTCAGLCCYEVRSGLCSIKLSTPLLKLRPRKDLIETLLHEMIHAFLFVTVQDRDRDGHGQQFQWHMHRINKEAGTRITIYHSFHAEVALYKQHHWRCDGPCRERRPYFGWVKRASNRAPSKNDLWWAEHERTCGGKYTKVSEPKEYTEKREKAEKKKAEGGASKKVGGASKKVGGASAKTNDVEAKQPRIDSVFGGGGGAILGTADSSAVRAVVVTGSGEGGGGAGGQMLGGGGAGRSRLLDLFAGGGGGRGRVDKSRSTVARENRSDDEIEIVLERPRLRGGTPYIPRQSGNHGDPNLELDNDDDDDFIRFLPPPDTQDENAVHDFSLPDRPPQTIFLTPEKHLDGPNRLEINVLKKALKNLSENVQRALDEGETRMDWIEECERISVQIKELEAEDDAGRADRDMKLEDTQARRGVVSRRERRASPPMISPVQSGGGYEERMGDGEERMGDDEERMGDNEERMGDEREYGEMEERMGDGMDEEEEEIPFEDSDEYESPDEDDMKANEGDAEPEEEDEEMEEEGEAEMERVPVWRRRNESLIVDMPIEQWIMLPKLPTGAVPRYEKIGEFERRKTKETKPSRPVNVDVPAAADGLMLLAAAAAVAKEVSGVDVSAAAAVAADVFPAEMETTEGGMEEDKENRLDSGRENKADTNGKKGVKRRRLEAGGVREGAEQDLKMGSIIDSAAAAASTTQSSTEPKSKIHRG